MGGINIESKLILPVTSILSKNGQLTGNSMSLSRNSKWVLHCNLSRDSKWLLRCNVVRGKILGAPFNILSSVVSLMARVIVVKWKVQLIIVTWRSNLIMSLTNKISIKTGMVQQPASGKSLPSQWEDTNCKLWSKSPILDGWMMDFKTSFNNQPYRTIERW